MLKLKHVSNMRNIAKKPFGISSSDTDLINLANTKETCSNLAIIVTIFPKLENVIDIAQISNICHIFIQIYPVC